MTDVYFGVSEEVRQLRRLRLLQVREQSKGIAKKIRDRVREEKYKQVSQDYAERRNQIEKEKRELQRLYELRLSTIGESHNLAAAEEQSKNEWIKESNLKKKQDSIKASERSKTALASFRENKSPNKAFERKNRSTQHESVRKSTGSPNEIDQNNESEDKKASTTVHKKRTPIENSASEKRSSRFESAKKSEENPENFFTNPHVKEFEGPKRVNTPFNRKKSSEIQTQSNDHRKSSMREEHDLAAAEDYLERESIKKVEDAIKALGKSKTSTATILKKRTSTENTSPERRTSRPESSRKNGSPTNKFDQYYEEDEALDNDCKNLSNEQSEITKKRTESHFSMNASPFPVKEGYNKAQYYKSDIIDSPIRLESQLSISDIEKALCECEPRLKSVVTNVHNLLRNNVKYDQITSQDINENFPMSSSDYLGGKPRIEKEKKVEFVPITIISDYLKNCDKIESSRINEKGALPHDNGSPLRKYSESEFSDVRRAEPSTISNDYRNVKNVGFSVDLQKENSRKNRTPKRVISSRIKSPVMCAPSQSNLKHRTLFNNKRIVKCFDYNNKFSKRALVNDDDIVKRLSKNKVDAFESAMQETLETNVVEKSLEVTKARLNELSRLRGEKALEKMKIEEDYKRLLEELEFLTKRERLISGNRDLKLREKMNNQDEHYGQSSANALNDEFNETESKLKTDFSTNVAHWDVCSEPTSKSKRDQLMDSESSVHSIIVQETRQVNTVVKHQQVVKDTEPAKPHRTKAKEKSASKKTKKTQKIAIENVDKNSPVISIKNDSTTDSQESSQTFTTSTVKTFEGLEIRIQMKRPKRESTSKKTFEMKNKEVQTAVSEFESSSEISIKASKIETRKEEIIMKKNSSLRFDSSDSTAYMSPPETSTYMNYMKKNKASNSSKNVVVIGNFDKSTNADHGVNRTIADDDCMHEKNSQELKISSRNDKSSHVGFGSSGSSGRLPKETISGEKLEKYVKRLLGISETEIKNLDVEVSNVTTPNSSVVNTSSNLKPPKCVDDKIDQVQTYIQESYELLEQLKKAHVSSSERIYKIGSQTKITKEQSENSSNGKSHSSNKPITNDQKANGKQKIVEDKIKKIDNGRASSVEDTNKAAASTFSRKSIQSNPEVFRKGRTDSSNESIINDHKVKGKQKIEDKIEKIDDGCLRSVEDIAAASPLSRKSMKSNSEDSRGAETDSSNKPENVQKLKEKQRIEDKIKKIDDGCLRLVDNINMATLTLLRKSVTSETEDAPTFDDQENKYQEKIDSNNIVEFTENEEALNKLGAEHAKRIQNFSQQLDRLRREKRLPFSSQSDDTGDSSLENQKVLKDIGFVPLLGDIPKPNSQNNILDFDHQQIGTINENPSPIYELNPNITPTRELFSNYPRNLSTIMEVDTPVTNKNSSTLIKNIDMDIEALRETLVNISDEKTDNEVSSIFEPNRNSRPPLLEYTNDVNVEPFVSLSQYVQSKPDEKIVPDIGGCNSSSEESISGLSELIATNKSLLKRNQPDKQLKNLEISGVCRMESSSGSLTPELDKLIKSFGPESMATWKKTEECQALSSSASSSSTLLDITRNDILNKLLDVTVTTVGLSTLHDDLDLDEDRQSQFSVLMDSLLKQKLDLLLRDMGKKSDPKKRAAEEVAIVMNLIRNKDDAKDTPDRSQGAKTMEFQSKDQTQHHTSTPMHPSKMSSTLKSGSQNSSKSTSRYRFSIDSDLSSVKNASSSLSSEDRLTIPNVSLKFNKLFDTDSSMQSDKQ